MERDAVSSTLTPTNAVDSMSRKQGSFYSWSFEIGATVLSFLAMISIIALLYVHDGRSLREWKFFLSLNTLISILGVICRTSLAFAMGACIGQQKWNWLRSRQDQLVAFPRFDEASRGPWGCFKLLYWLKAR
jgi:hypothetical protein